jgi:Glycosyl hydrolase catalytic core
MRLGRRKRGVVAGKRGGSQRAARTLLAQIIATALLAALPAAAGAARVGVGGITAQELRSPLFGALHVREARVVVPWNAAIARNPSARRQFAAWLRAARDARVTPLVSFYGEGSQVPTVRQYERAVSVFIHRFPSVHRYTAWNEPDWPHRRLARRPRLAAEYFNALSSRCRRCLVLAGDVFLPAKRLRPWLRAYVKALGRRPRGWALHNYHDVRDHSAAQLRVMLALTRGPIWLDETGGVLTRGHWRSESATKAAADERYLFSLPRRFRRISRIYHYQWQAVSTAGWDSALLSPQGTPRPAYWVLAARR